MGEHCDFVSWLADCTKQKYVQDIYLIWKIYGHFDDFIVSAQFYCSGGGLLLQAIIFASFSYTLVFYVWKFRDRNRLLN